MSERTGFDRSDPLLAAAAWSRVTEPGDEVAGALVGALGAVAALEWLFEVVDGVGGGAAVRGSGRLEEALGAVGTAASRERLARAVGRWAPRLDGLDPRRELRVLTRLGGRLVAPGSPGWPTVLDDLGSAAPRCLWVRGDLDVGEVAARSVALVGARACTDYGRHVTTDLAEGLASRGFTVVSGGAYGIDAAAHRGALAGGGPTLAFLAGGVDRLYPAGNADLLKALVEAGGAVVSEVPPGSVPSRVRFLLRNRLIAATATATVVVEAAWRSGALSTAARARDLGRPVGAVPGPVTSVASSGCHRILRDGAVCVTDADDVADLAGAIGADLAPEPHTTQRPGDGLDPVAARVLDAVPLRTGATPTSVARAAGLSFDETIGALALLELDGLVAVQGDRWRHTPRQLAPGRCAPAGPRPGEPA